MRPQDNEANADRCLCPGCPTYSDCTRDAGERLFCSRGQTKCRLAENGCLCGDCPVWAEHELSQFYYCIEGAEPWTGASR
jgi:hypothetical protein